MSAAEIKRAPTGATLPAPITGAVRSAARAGRTALAVGILWCISLGANALASRLHLTYPGNALAIALTFGLLATRCLPAALLEVGASLLIRNLSLFFVPFAVGIVALPEMMSIAPAIIIVIVVSVSIGIAAAAITAQALRRS